MDIRNKMKEHSEFKKLLHNVSKHNNRLDLSREELIIKRLEDKLGKSKGEIKKMISDDLLSILAIVPANN